MIHKKSMMCLHSSFEKTLVHLSSVGARSGRHLTICHGLYVTSFLNMVVSKSRTNLGYLDQEDPMSDGH